MKTNSYFFSKIQAALNNKNIKQNFFNLKNKADEFIKKNYSNISRGFYPSAEATTQIHIKTKKLVLRFLNLNEFNYDVFFNNDPEFIKQILNENTKTNFIKIDEKKTFLENNLSGFNLIIFNSFDLNTFYNTYVVCVKKAYLEKIKPTFLGGGMVQTVTKNDTSLYEKSIKKMEAGTQPIIQIIHVYFAIKISS